MGYFDAAPFQNLAGSGLTALKDFSLFDSSSFTTAPLIGVSSSLVDRKRPSGGLRNGLQDVGSVLHRVPASPVDLFSRPALNHYSAVRFQCKRENLEGGVQESSNTVKSFDA